MGRCHRPCRRSLAWVSAADGPPDGVGLRGSTPEPSRRVSPTPGVQNKCGLPEEHPDRRPPPCLRQAGVRFVPSPRSVFPTPQPLFSRKQNCRPKTTCSSTVARTRSTRSKTCARYSAQYPAPPSRAAAASRSKDADIPPVRAASGRCSAECAIFCPNRNMGFVR